MSVTNTPLRRILTVIAVAASLVIGFGAIRASAAWTAQAAPLTVAPVSAETLKTRLADEAARSADLADRLAALTSHSEELSSALAAAETRIASDTDNATQLTNDLAAAKKKLAALEKSIRDASRVRTTTAPTTTRTTSSGSTSGGDDDHEGGGDD
jgi:septal ring factor EnvC (AmiA/AmiB activator)